MSSPFSDTTSPSTLVPSAWDEAQRLAKRLSIPFDIAEHPGRWQSLTLAGLNAILDRLEAAEKRMAERTALDEQSQAHWQQALAESDPAKMQQKQLQAQTEMNKALTVRNEDDRG